MSDLLLSLPEVCTSGNAATMQLPDIDLYNHWNLFTNRILCVDGEITDWDYALVKNIIMFNLQDALKPREERNPILILINSNGGLLDVSNAVVDAIKASTTPVWTVNTANALSGGCLIFLAGERRFAMPNSWCLAHEGSGGTAGTYAETKEQSRVWDEQVRRMGEYIMGRTGIDEKTWKKYKNKDWWMNCDQQLEYGFATDRLESLDELLNR